MSCQFLKILVFLEIKLQYGVLVLIKKLTEMKMCIISSTRVSDQSHGKDDSFFYLASLSFENPSESLLLSGKLPPVFCYGSAFWWEYCVLSLASVSKRLFDFSKIIFLPKTTKRLLLSLFFPLSSFLPRKAESEAIKKQLSWEQREGNLWQLSPADWGSLNLCLPTQSSVVCYFLTWTHPFVKLSFVCVDDVVPAAVCSDKSL